MVPSVVVTEYGRAASTALAEALVAAKQGSALAPVTVVVSSNFAGLAARRMLGSGALGVAGVANVNFLTPFRFAELLAVGELRGRKPLTNPVLGAAVRRALAEDPRHFAAVRDHQATERALASVVGELSNVSPQGLDAIEADGGHAASIVGLYRSITSHLRGFHDEADVARAASRRVDLANMLEPYGHVIWHLPGPLSAPLAGFVRSVLAATPATVVVASAGDSAADAQVARTLRIAGVGLPPTLDDATGRDAEVPTADHIISVTDADEEVRAVVRAVVQLIEEGVAPDRIGVFHPVADPYVRILEQHFDAAAIPVNGPSRRRLSDMIAGRVVLAALALPAERWRRDRVIALVNSGPLRHGNTPTRPAVWDQLSRRAGVLSGLGDWRTKLEAEKTRTASGHDEAIAAGRHELATRLARHGRDCEDLRAFIDSLASMVQQAEQASGWQARSEAVAELLRSLLGSAAQRVWWNDAELDAFDAVETALERLASLDDIDPKPTMAAFQRALAAELGVARGRNGRFGDGVVYGPLSSAPGHDLDAVFVLGCAEGLCPTPRREDVLLPDAARRLTKGDLPERLGQIDEQHRLFLAAIASAPRGRRWLLLPRGNLRSSRRSRPSRWLLATASKLAGRQLFSTDFEHGTPPGVREVASYADGLVHATCHASVDERDLAVVLAHVRNGGEASAHPATAAIEDGLVAQRARRGASFTEYDGNLGGLEAGSATPPSGTVLSASQLETWAACGFRYYLGYVLGLSERDDPERIVELSALDRGSAVHEVLERFMTEMVELGVPQPHEPWNGDQRVRAQQIAAEVLGDYERKGRTGRAIEWEVQKSDLFMLIDEFLTADDAYRALNGATPARFELAFGMDDRPALEVSLDSGRVLKFRGKIDRVDTAESRDVFVIDYKTGKGERYGKLADGDPTKAGTVLQLGLYAEAVAQQLDVSSVASQYWMVDPRGDYKQHGYEWTQTHRERLVDVLSMITEGIDSGVHVQVPGEWNSFASSYENCRYCDFDRVCPRDRAEHAADKADAPELAVRVRLTTPPAPAEGAGPA